MTSAMNNLGTNVENNTYCHQHKHESGPREWLEPGMVLDAFVTLVCEPHDIVTTMSCWSNTYICRGTATPTHLLGGVHNLR